MATQSSTALVTQATTNLPNNTGESISPTDVRQQHIDNAESMWNIVDSPQVSAGEITAGTEAAVRMWSPANMVSMILAHTLGVAIVNTASDDLDAALAKKMVVYTYAGDGTLNLVDGMTDGDHFFILNVAGAYELTLAGKTIVPTALFRNGDNVRLGPGDSALVLHTGSDTYDIILFPNQLAEGHTISRYNGATLGWSNLSDGDHDIYHSLAATLPAPVVSSGNLIIPLAERLSSADRLASVLVSGDEAVGRLGIGYKGIYHPDSGRSYAAAQCTFFDMRQRMALFYIQWSGSAFSYANLQGDFGAPTFITNTVNTCTMEFVTDGSGDLYFTVVQESTGDPDIYVLANNSVNSNQISIQIRDRATRGLATSINTNTRIFIERRFHGASGSNANLDADDIPGFTGNLENTWAQGKITRNPYT